MASEVSGGGLDAELQDEQTVKRFAKYLHATIPLREAVQLSKRVNYFRGKKLIDALLAAPDGGKNRPQCASEEDAVKVGLALLRTGMIHASEISDKKKKELRPTRSTDFSADGFYTWIYEGSKTMRNLMLGLLVLAVTAMCLFPVWPQSAKVGIWYISVTLLIFLFVLFTLRLVLYMTLWSVGCEFWILPNFFDEDLGVADSFRPVYSFSRAQDIKETWYFRGAGLAALLAFAFWCSQQPTEFDELYAQQMDFLAELYDGKLLGDGAQTAEEQAAAIGAVPKLEDLEREIAADAELGDDDEEEEEEDEALLDKMAAEEGDDDDEDDKQQLDADEERVVREAKEALDPDAAPLGSASDEADVDI